MNPTAPRKTCQRCGAAFGCGATGDPCWCSDEAFRLPLPNPGESEFTDCLCTHCLREVAASAGLSPRAGAR